MIKRRNRKLEVLGIRKIMRRLDLPITDRQVTF
jgi:hypothetical protein